MAEAALAAHHAGRVRVVIGRASDFYGPGVTSSAVGERVFPALIAGRPAQVLGNPDVPHTYTYIGDFGRALVLLGSCEQAFGQAWHVPNPETTTTREFLRLAAQAVGRPLRVQAAGPVLLTLAGLLNREVREFWELRYEFEQPYVVDSSRFEAAFGLRATPLAEAIAETVAWYQSKVRSGT
jgi:nucleoside-diphosphate-sugar epimerase